MCICIICIYVYIYTHAFKCGIRKRDTKNSYIKAYMNMFTEIQIYSYIYVPLHTCTCIYICYTQTTHDI